MPIPHVLIYWYLFTDHVFGITCHSSIYFLITIYTTLEIVSAKPKIVLHIVGGKILLHQFFVRRRRGVIFASFNFGITQSLVLAYIAQHLLVEVDGTLVILSFAKSKDSSTHAFLTLVFG